MEDLFKINTNNKRIDKHLNLCQISYYGLRNVKDKIKLETGKNISYSELANISIKLFIDHIKEINKEFTEEQTIKILEQLIINSNAGKELLENTGITININKTMGA